MASAIGSYGYAIDQPALTLDERISSLFQPDTLLPTQYFQNFRGRAFLQPEKRLMLAVLEDAVNCYQNNLWARGGKAKRLFEEAEEWILEEDGEWPFSFVSICETLGLNPQYLRQGLLRWKEKKQRQPADAKIWQRGKWSSRWWRGNGARGKPGKELP